MQKRKILILAVLCAVALAGCKKRDPIDLSTLHTTEAAEPETAAQAEETEAAETESAGAPASSGLSVEASITSETSGNASIEYPVLSNMKDSEKQDQINATLKANAMAAADAWPGNLTIRATVESVNLRRITVTYRGSVTENGKTERVFFANTVDLETAENLRLTDLTDAYTLAGYISSGDYKLSELTGDEAVVRSELGASGRTTEYYYGLLQNADFSGGYTEDSDSVSWPEIFSFEKGGVVYVSLPVSSEAGDYVLIHYSPDNK